MDREAPGHVTRRSISSGPRPLPFAILAFLLTCSEPRSEIPTTPDPPPPPDAAGATGGTGAAGPAGAAGGSDGSAASGNAGGSGGGATPGSRDGSVDSDDATTITCTAGHHACGSPGAQECRDNDDLQTCGTSCSPCPAMKDADQVCRNQTCDFSCKAHAVTCNGNAGAKVGCARIRWDFEDPTSDGDDWAAALGNDVAAVTNSFIAGRGVAASRARKIAVNVGPGKLQVLANAVNCPGTVDLAQKTMSVQIFVEGGPPGATHMCGLGGSAISPGGDGLVGSPDRDSPVPSGQWTRLTYRFADPRAAFIQDIYVDCYLASAPAWTGAVYLDDIKVE